MRRDIYGAAFADWIPDDLSETLLLNKVTIPLHIFLDDEFYTSKERGKILAAIVIKTNLETIERVKSTMQRNKDKQKSKDTRETRKATKPKHKKARTTNRYRRRRK